MSARFQPHQLKAQALLNALRVGRLVTEEGTDEVVDFEYRGRDALDFMTVSRGTLERMLAAAYDAGLEDGRARPNNRGQVALTVR